MSTANSLNFACDWRLGFNVSARRKGTVGYLLWWSGCGGLTLAKDIEVWNPFGGVGQTVLSGPQVTCAGLIERFDYDGGDDDPIRIRALVSAGAAANIRAKRTAGLPNTKLKVTWYIVSFDEERKAWYEAALIKDADKVDAVVDTLNGVLQLLVDSEPTPIAEHLDVLVHGLEFQIVPAKGKSARLQFATGPVTRVVLPWSGQ